MTTVNNSLTNDGNIAFPNNFKRSFNTSPLTFQQQVWFVTGASKGIGLTIAKRVLARGDVVCATSRSVDQLKAAGLEGVNFLGLKVDLAKVESVEKAVQQCIERYGRLDIVVNNAGYCQSGTVEELSDDELRANMDINFYGAVNVMRAVTPHLRTRRTGHVFNISSICGFYAFDACGAYSASKFAMEGMSEAYASEMRPFGVKVTLVKPGYFRTEFLSSNSLPPYSRNKVDAYAHIHKDSEEHNLKMDGKQQGSPDKLVDLLFKVVAHDGVAPMHLFVGADSYGLARKKLLDIAADLDAWESQATITDFDE
eukprot:gene5636-6505_t